MLNQENFKNKFQLPFSDFLTARDFTDGGFGFSTIKKYPNGYASLFKIYVRNTENLKEYPLKMVEASVSYGKDSEDGIILSSSSEKIKGLFDPTDLISLDDFSYNFETETFFYKNEEILAKRILELLDDWHNKTTKLLGRWLVLKLFWFHYLLAWFWKMIFKIISGFQYLVSGEKIKIFDDLIRDPNNSFSPNLSESIDVKKSELIDLWGYKVKPWIAGSYAAIHLLGYIVFYNYNYSPLWLVTIFNNSFLTFMYGIVSLGLANAFLPILLKPVKLKKVLKLIQSFYMKAASKKVKI